MHLDFLHPHRRSAFWGWLLLALGLAALAVAAGWRFLELEPRVQAGEAQLLSLQQRFSAREPVAVLLSDTQLAADWTQADSVAQQLATPWSALFSLLEGGAGQHVALLSLESDGARRELLISGEARDYPALLDYFRYLQQQEVLSAVALQTHQVNRQDKDMPVRFRITAHWERAS